MTSLRALVRIISHHISITFLYKVHVYCLYAFYSLLAVKPHVSCFKSRTKGSHHKAAMTWQQQKIDLYRFWCHWARKSDSQAAGSLHYPPRSASSSVRSQHPSCLASLKCWFCILAMIPMSCWHFYCILQAIPLFCVICCAVLKACSG